MLKTTKNWAFNPAKGGAKAKAATGGSEVFIHSYFPYEQTTSTAGCMARETKRMS